MTDRHRASIEPGYFETMFRETKDPWDLETSDYERDKYAATVGALGDRMYPRAFEVGCAKGVLTQSLAMHCDSLLSVDVSETAVAAARDRNDGARHVSFNIMRFPERAPTTQFDLVVLSEVVYYWDDCDIQRAANWLSGHVAPGGDVLLVHWTGPTDYPQSGDDAVTKIQAGLAMPISVVFSQRTAHYRLDLWRRPS